jgi:hypothetical protein
MVQKSLQRWAIAVGFTGLLASGLVAQQVQQVSFSLTRQDSQWLGRASFSTAQFWRGGR